MGSDWQTKLLTPPGPAGVAVLEVAGPDVWRALARIGLAERPVGALALAALQLPNGPGDEALLWVRAEERVELHVHGSGPLLDELSLALAGTRIDPVGLEDRAFQALAAAPSRTGARLILAQAEGALRQRLESLASADSRSARAGLETLLAHSRACTPWFSPQRLVLQGPVNAGKSTLFNALVGYERVITSDEAGTTRDAIIERIQLGTVPIDLIDTAGLRAVTAESLEGRGQALGQWLAQSADWTLYLVPPGERTPCPPGAIALPTQADRPGAHPGAISARNDPAGSAQAVCDLILPRLGLPEPLPWGEPLLWEPAQRTDLEATLADSDRSCAQAWITRMLAR